MIRTLTTRPGLALTCLALTSWPAWSAGPEPALAIGTVQRVPAVSVSLAVGSTDRETKRVVYSPPPGWYIRSHHVELGDRTGLASYSVSTLAAGWQYKSSEREGGATRSRVAGQVSSHKLSSAGWARSRTTSRPPAGGRARRATTRSSSKSRLRVAGFSAAGRAST